LGARDHLKKIFSDHEKLKLQLESQKKEFELRGRELEKREAQNENESKYLAEEIEKVHFFFSFPGIKRCRNYEKISCILLHLNFGFQNSIF